MEGGQYAKDSNSNALPPIFTHAFLIIFLLLLISGLSFSAWGGTGANCWCTASCTDCTSALNSTSCTQVNITGAIASTTGDCINDPINFANKVFDCRGYTLDGDLGSGDYGIYLEGSGNSNNTIKNCRITDFQYGIFFYNSANNNQAINNTIASCSSYGIYLPSSSYSNLANNTIYNNQYGIYLSSSTFNRIINNSIYNNSLNGIRLSGSSSNNLTNNSVYNNTLSGIRVAGSNNNIANNTVYGNRQNGFELVNACSNNNLTGNRAYNNTQSGINLSSCTTNTPMSKNTIYGNGLSGIYSYNTVFSNAADNHIYNNTGGEVGLSSTSTYAVSFTNLTLDNPYGNFTNYTSMDISDTLEANSAYRIKWTRNSSSPPTEFASFRQKFVNISVVSGSPNITSITFNWLTSELTGYQENKFRLYKWQGSWTDLNSSPDTANNRLTIYNVASFSDFGILQYNGTESCPIVNTSGTFTMLSDYTGAPNYAPEIDSWDYACVKIGASNVVFDCNGHSITGNGTPGVHQTGILINSSVSNVTVKNCIISNYSTGILTRNSSSNTIINNKVYNSTQNGISLMYSSRNNRVINNIVRNSTYSCIYSFFTHNATLANNTAYECRDGIYLTTSQNSTITNNTAYNNSRSGITMSNLGGAYGLFNGTFINNTAYNNPQGFFFADTNNSKFMGNTAFNNTNAGFNISTEPGFYNRPCYYNNFTNNTAYRNGIGFIVIMGSGNNYYENTAQGNTLGLYLQNTSSERIRSMYFYNNSKSLVFNNTGYAGISYNATGLIFMNSAGNRTYYYTNLSIDDTSSAAEEYSINWTTNSSSPPYSYTVSFARKFVNITAISGSVSIDSIAWSWNNGELTGYNESKLELWKYNSAWSNTLATLDTGANTLSLSNMNPASEYAILQNNETNCPLINSPGTYVQGIDYVGSTNFVNALPNNLSICIYINTSNVTFDCNGHSITGNKDPTNASSGYTYGAYIGLESSLSNITVKNCDGISGYYRGIETGISGLSHSTFSNNTIYNMTNAGISISPGSNNTIANNTVNRVYWGISLGRSNSGTIANNTVHNTTYAISLSSSNRTMISGNTLYNNSQGMRIQNQNYNNNITNNLIHSNSGTDAGGIYLSTSSSNNTFINNSIYNNSPNGIYSTSSSYYSTFINNRIYNNSQYGIYVRVAYHNTFINNSIYNNSRSGIIVVDTTFNNSFINNSLFNNTEYGIYLISGNNSILSNNRFFNNLRCGLVINNTNNTVASGDHYYGNGRDLIIQSTSSSAYRANLTNIILDNPSGSLENFTNLSLYDTFASSAYSINWSRNSSGLPADRFSFAQKFINISAISGTASLDSITWHWDESEVAGIYNDTKFQLWKYNSSGWGSGPINATPDPGANTLTQYDMNPASIYAILQNNASENCPVISSPGIYTMATDYTGAPNDASDVSFDSYACLRINSSDVEFDCSGFSITGNDSLGTTQYGVLVYGPFTNVTLKNCIVSSYDFGVYAYQSENGSFENNTAYNNTYCFFLGYSYNNTLADNTAYNNTYGIYLTSSSSNNIINNSAYNNSQYGFYLPSSSNNTLFNNSAWSNSWHGIVLEFNSNNNLTSNNAYNNSAHGIYFGSSSNNTLTNNNAYNNSQYGIILSHSSNNALTNNSAYNNSQYGIYLGSSSNNNLTSNNAYNNSQEGFYISSSSNNNLTDNNAYNNTASGIHLQSSSNNNLTNNSAYNNSIYGIWLQSSSDFNTLTNNTAYNNTQSGIYFSSSNFNNLTNNTATNSLFGIYLSSSSNNNLANNTAYNNTQSGIYLSSSNFNNLTNNTATNSLFGIYLSSSSNNNLANNTASGNGNGIRIQSSSSNNIINNNASGNTNGIFILSSINNNLINNTASGNTQNGIVLQNNCNFNNLTNNNASGNTQRGIYLQTNCNFNNLTDNTAGGNLQNGIFLQTSSSNTLANNSAYNSQNGISLGVRSHLNNLTGNSVHNNTYGIVISLSNSTRITGSPVYDNAQYGISINNANSTVISGAHFHNNSLDFWMQTPAATYEVNLTNALFDNPYGNLENYTNLSLFDIAAASSTYSINWTTNSAALPGQAVSFEQKFVNISVQSGTASIDSIIWSWASSEEAGYTPALFRLVKYNSSGWSYINDSPDTGARTLSAYNLNPQSDYGILQYVANVSALKLYQVAQQPSPGGVVQFNITVTNTGNVTLNTTVWDTLPENLTFSNSDPAYNYSSPPSYGWLISIDAGQTQIIYINATVDPGAVSALNPIVNATNYANATGTSALSPPVFAESYADATIYYANVSAIKLDQTLYQPSPGGMVNFQLNITNIGNVTLDPITLVDTLPAGLDYSNADLTPDSTAGGILTWNNIGPISPGATTIILLNATVNESATATQCTVTLTNSIDVEGMPPNGNNVTASDSEDVVVKCANVSAIKLDQTLYQPSPGGTVEFNITITNEGNVTLDPTEVIDTLPAGLTYANAIPAPDSTAGPIIWNNVGPLDPGASATLLLNATMDSSNCDYNVTNTVDVAGVPPNGNNATAYGEEELYLACANLSLLKVDITPFPPSQGGIVEYRIVVTNTGNVTIYPLEVVDTLPTGFTFNSTDTPGYILSGQDITWSNVGPLSAGSAITILLNATVDSGTPTGTYTNTVDAQGTPPNGYDVFASSNATVGVNTSAINIVKTASSYTAMVGDEISFILNITNSGETNLTIYATDTLPDGTTFMDAIPYPDSIVGQTLYWNAVALLEPAQYFEIAYNSSMDKAGEMANNAIVTGVPPNGDNVTHSAAVTIDVASPPSDDDDAEEFECITSYDCEECYFCRAHACELLEGYCAQDSDCTMYGEGYYCDDCLCMHPECVEDSECAPGYTCINYECMPPECWSDADCRGGFYCEEYECKEKPPWPEEEPIEVVPVEPEEKPPLITPEGPEPAKIVEISVPVLEPPQGGEAPPAISLDTNGQVALATMGLLTIVVSYYLLTKKKKHKKIPLGTS